jgi:3-hydroxyisobutyrate dehydrogenase
MPSIALLGTGLLGSAFVEGLLARGGAEVTVWNRTRARAEPLAERGARVADTPADAVRGAERVHLVLLDDDVVDETIEALRPGLGAGVVIVDHTTTLPARTAARAARLEAAGVAYLHAPVFMGPAAARDAKGVMMVAGPRARFELVREALAPMTGDLWYVGERVDLAAAYKLFGNAMLLSMSGAIADIAHMADALGVDRAGAFSVFDHFGVGGVIGMRAPKLVAEDFTPSFTLEVARKDVRLMLESAGAEPVPVLAALASRMDALIAGGLGGDDVIVLARRGV